MPEIRITGTGVGRGLSIGQRAGQDRRLDELIARAERTGDHIWCAMVAYHITDPDAPNQNLDTENLIGWPGVGCYRCEQPYARRLRHRRCPGDPKAER